MTVPTPRAPHERIRPCTKHHTWHVNCPECCEWHRDLLRAEREEAAERKAAG